MSAPCCLCEQGCVLAAVGDGPDLQDSPAADATGDESPLDARPAAKLQVTMATVWVEAVPYLYQNCCVTELL